MSTLRDNHNVYPNIHPKSSVPLTPLTHNVTEPVISTSYIQGILFFFLFLFFAKKLIEHIMRKRRAIAKVGYFSEHFKME